MTHFLGLVVQYLLSTLNFHRMTEKIKAKIILLFKRFQVQRFVS